MESDESRGAAQPPPTPAGLRAGCHVHPPGSAPCCRGPGEQMLGSGLALPGSLAAECWRQAGVEETPRDVHEHTHTHCRSLPQPHTGGDESQERVAWAGTAACATLSHLQSIQASPWHSTVLPPKLPPRLCPNIPSLTPGLSQAHQEQSLHTKPWLRLYTSVRRDHKKAIRSG